MKDDNVYLNHIKDSIERIEEYLENISYENYKNNHLVQDGIIRQLMIIGEAVKLISEKTKSKNLSVPWKDIAGMRDKLIHAYFGTDLDAVWKTAKEDLHPLKKEIIKLLKN